MVEQVARGRLTLPAAAALGLVTLGAVAPAPAMADGRQATLQIRVQVVNACRIVLSGKGKKRKVTQVCGAGAGAPEVHEPVTILRTPRTFTVGEGSTSTGDHDTERVQYVTIMY